MKILLKSLLVVMFLSLFTSSTLALADEKEEQKSSSEQNEYKETEELNNIKFKSQKEELDALKRSEDLETAIKYEIKEEGLTNEQKKELINYKSKIIKQIEKAEEKNREKRSEKTRLFIIIILSCGSLLSLGLFSLAFQMRR